MSKANLIIFGIVGVAVIGGGVFFIAGRSGEGPRSGDRLMEQNQRTIKGLIATGKDQKCTFSESNDISSSSGTVYFSKGKMRGDFEAVTKAQGIKVISHMVVDGDTSYVWTENPKQGFKMGISEMEGTQGSSNTSQSVDINQELDYDCDSWSPDSSKFELPTDITFNSIADMMNGVMPSGAGSSGSGSASVTQCGQCDKIPDPAGKQYCRQSLACK